MQYRITRDELIQVMSIWNGYLKKQVHLIACGGTALTLLNIKESTKDIDLIVPSEVEYRYLIKQLSSLGYQQITGCGWTKDKRFIFNLYSGQRIFTTGLLESPLKKGNNILFKEFSSIYLGVLNFYDLIISKLFRYSPVDVQDCKDLIRAKRKDIDLELLKERFYETSAFDISDDKNKRYFRYFMREIEEE